MNTLKSGFITLLGLPNAGKSSLLNKLVGENLAIVTPKPQTTWQLMRGYVLRDGLEAVVTDTPGIQEGTKALNAALAKNAAAAIKLAHEGQEVVAFVIDVADLGRRIRDKKPLGLEAVERTLERECGRLPLKLPVIPLLNKADLVRKPEYRSQILDALLPILARCFETALEPIWLSVLSGEGIETLVEKLKSVLPEGEKGSLFSEDALSDKTLREFASEYVREQCFMQLGEEVPYSIAVEIERFEENDPKLTRIEAVLHVERESQKALVIGKGGLKIKAIGTKARGKIEELTQKKVYLGLRVKVTPHWAREQKWVERFGYVVKT